MSVDQPEAPASTLPTLPGFKLLAELYRDRLGVVYHARQPLYRRDVALRLVDDSAHAGMRDLTGVCRAADNAGRHGHANLVPLYEANENQGQFYLASDMPPGPSLRERLARGSLSPDEAAGLIAVIARAVDHLHKHHALHLGLTSACVFLNPDGTPCVGDLGLTGLLHNRPGAAYPGDPAYAAPEQLANKEADARADVYALGRLLAECLAVKLPSGRVALPGCPPALARICGKAISSRPGARYASAADLADDLERFRRGEAPAPGALANLVSSIQRIPAVPLLAALLLVLLGSAALAMWLSKKVDTARAEARLLAAHAEQARHEALVQVADSKMVLRDEAEKIAAARRDADNQAHLAKLDRDRERKSAVEEHKRRVESEQRYKEELKRRMEAEDHVKSAEEERKTALAFRSAVAGELVGLHVGHGTALLEAGDLTGALRPFVRALAVASREKLPEEAHRLRIAALLTRCPRPISVFRFAKGDTTAVSLSPDGRRVLVIGADGVAAVHDAASAELLGKRVTHGAPVALAIFSPDGRRVLSADARGRVRLWNTEDGELVFEAVELEAVPVHLSFSGDGKRFLVVCPTRAGAEAFIHEAVKGGAIGEPITAQVAPRPGGLSQDGSRVVLCGTDGSARLYDVATGKQVGPALEHGGTLALAAFSADGRTVLTAGDGAARVWVAATGKDALPRLEHASSEIAPQLDEGGRLVLVIGADGGVRVHDVTTGKQAGPTLRSRTTLRRAVLSADGRSVLLAGDDGQAQFLDLASGRPTLPALTHSAPLMAAGFAADGARALTFDGRILRVWDLTKGESLAPPGHADEASAVYNADGTRVARLQGDTVQVQDASGKPIGAAMKHKGAVKSVSFSSTGALLLTVTDPPEGATTPTWDVRVWDAGTGRPVSEPMEHLREVTHADFASGGTQVLSLSLDKKVRLWDAKMGKRLGQPMEHPEDVVLAQVSPDGRYVVSSDKTGMTKIWTAATGEAVGKPLPHAASVRALAFRGDSKVVATCCADGTTSVWELETAARTQRFEHAEAVTTGRFSPGGNLLLTGCADGTARVWSVLDGKPLTPPLLHDEPVRATAFSDDGRWILTAAGRFVRLWDARNGEPIGPPLPHAHGNAAVSQMSFSKTGELITQAGPGTRWARTLAPDGRPEADLLDLALVLSGREEAGPGQLAPASAATFEAAWRRASEKHAAEFTPVGARVRASARRGADECEARGLWGGVIRHLTVLLDDSIDATLLARRAKARAEMKRYEGALADYGKALDKDPNHAVWWAGRGAVAAALSKWDRAAADYTEAVKREERNGEWWRQLGRAQAERGKWKEAGEALTKAVRFGSPEPIVAHEQAVALLAAGDAKGYQQAVRAMVKRFGGRGESGARQVVADAGVLAPDAVADYKGLLDAAELAVKASPEDTREQARLAALLLRAGQAARAVTILEKLAAEDRAGPTELWMLVLAQHKAGQKDKAKEWQGKATAAKQREGASWAERQVSALWQREAEKE